MRSEAKKLYDEVIKKIEVNAKYPYQLTEWVSKKGELLYAIKQIEQYEGKGKGYYIGEKGGKWAVFTKGDLVHKQGYVRKPESDEGEYHTIFQYRDIIRRAKR